MYFDTPWFGAVAVTSVSGGVVIVHHILRFSVWAPSLWPWLVRGFMILFHGLGVFGVCTVTTKRG